ncbi:MAG: S8 family serine peptidase [Dehalococcoidia bacterium]
MLRSISLGVLAVVLVVVAAYLDGAGDRSEAAPDPDVIPGRYIVTLTPGIAAHAFAQETGSRLGFRADVVYSHALNGFAANLPAQAAQALARDSGVLSIEPDRIARVTDQILPTGIDRIDVDENSTAGIAGDGGAMDVDIAIIDTGIDVDHPDLNVVGGARFSGSGFAIFWTCDNGSGSFDDDNAHGTHVAGTAAARDNSVGVVGVAPGARLHAVKVLTSGGTGAYSCIIMGIDWVTARADTIDVANMSLGGGSSSALCNAIQNSVNAGVVYAVAAGNEIVDAETRSPANCAPVVTVSAIADFDGKPGGLQDETIAFSSCTETEDDSFACFSNFGSTIEVAAPGVKILSTLPGGGTGTGSGTSMASPHVAGAIALYKVANPAYNTSHGPTVIADMTADGWTVPQDSPCGFDGDPDSYPEPLIYGGSSCLGGATPTPSPTPSPTPTPTASPEPTPTPTPTASPAPTPTPTPAPDGTMHVASLSGISISQGSTWVAQVTITVHDSANNPVADATVFGSWSLGSPSSGNCTTNGAGQCTLTSGSIPKRNSSVTFTVTNVTYTTLVYDPSGTTSITIAKP